MRTYSLVGTAEKKFSTVDSMHIQWNYDLICQSGSMESAVENIVKDGSSTQILFTREWLSTQDNNQK